VVRTSRKRGTDVDLERQTLIRMRVSAEEKRKFEKLAKSRYTNLSELVRQLLHREADNNKTKAAA
jgi:hypothetical protein